MEYNTENLQIFFILVNVSEAQHVRVVDEFHDGNFPFHLHQHRIGEFLAIDDLYCDFFAGDTVDPQLHQAWMKKNNVNFIIIFYFTKNENK